MGQNLPQSCVWSSASVSMHASSSQLPIWHARSCVLAISLENSCVKSPCSPECHSSAAWLPVQELRTLGKGGYGLVVAAVNRLDGRQYAVKKIRMPAGAPAAGSRLMREVATLARLQAPNIVRYFQARAPPESRFPP